MNFRLTFGKGIKLERGQYVQSVFSVCHLEITLNKVIEFLELSRKRS